MEMKPIVTVILALTVSRCFTLEEVVPIEKYENRASLPDGSYKWSYETANGIAAEEEAHLDSSNALQVKGFYSYVSPEGVPISIFYSADKNGFKAEGASIPQPSPIPKVIQKALDWNAAHPEEEEIETKPPSPVPISFPGRFGEEGVGISSAAIKTLQNG